jgi:hypothetical protein
MERETAPQEARMPDTVTAQILALQKMTVAELRVRWRELYGEDTRSCNRAYLCRRLAWRVQEIAYGGLSARAKARIAELNRDDDLRMLPPRGWKDALEAATARAPRQDCGPVKDPRLPKPGAILSRLYRGHEIRVTILEKGFEWEGRPYRSLSAIARAVTGQKWNGLLFFGLTDRKGRS